MGLWGKNNLGPKSVAVWVFLHWLCSSVLVIIFLSVNQGEYMVRLSIIAALFFILIKTALFINM